MQFVGFYECWWMSERLYASWNVAVGSFTMSVEKIRDEPGPWGWQIRESGELLESIWEFHYRLINPTFSVITVFLTSFVESEELSNSDMAL